MKKYITRLLNAILSRGGGRLASPKNICLLRYVVKFRRFPDINNPKDLNEKLLWLEFNTDTTSWTELADKYRVRKYVEDKGLSDILVKLYGVYENAYDIDFSDLPQSFVIKTNNGYGTVLLVKEKSTLNEHKLKKMLNEWLKEPYGYITGEPHYTRIKPCILIEELLDKPEGQTSLIDYKFWCFNGKPHCCFVCTNRNAKTHKAEFCYYEIPSWTRRIDLMSPKYYNETIVPKPSRLGDMIKYAQILSEGFPLVRVDLYEVKGKVYLGEMTFTSNGGRMSYFSRATLLSMGNNLDISKVNNAKA